MKRLLRYIAEIKSYGLLFGATPDGALLQPYGYSDSDYARSVVDRKSVSEHVFLLNGAAVSYASRKQTSVAMSTTEAEYVAVAAAAKEGIWLQRLLRSTMLKEWKEPLELKVDNSGAYHLATNDARNLNDRTKHVDIKHHFIREKVKQGELAIQLIP